MKLSSEYSHFTIEEMRPRNFIPKSQNCMGNANIQIKPLLFLSVLISLKCCTFVTHGAFPFGSSHFSAVLQDLTPVTSHCHVYFTLPCNRKFGTLTSHFFPLLHGIAFTVRSFIYLPMLLFSDFHYNSCSFLFLVFPVCMGLLSAILCSGLSSHIVGSPKMLWGC